MAEDAQEARRARRIGRRGRRARDYMERPPPAPQPERHEPRLEDPGLLHLSTRDYAAVLARAGRKAIDDNITGLASALAYHGFLAIPAVLLLLLGLLGVAGTPETVNSIVARLDGVAPSAVLDVLDRSLKNVARSQGSGALMVAVGTLLAVWTVLGAMTTLMWALNAAYERRETRSFLRQRGTALAMFGCALLAVLLTVGLLVLGPYLSGAAGDAVGESGLFGWLWWVAQWPIQIAGLLTAFAGILYLGPDVEHPRWQFVTPGSVFAVLAWLLVSGGFALYAAHLGSYESSWGTLSTVIVVLTWLWLSSLALLFGAEVNAEAERSRELRRGEPAERRIQAPPRGAPAGGSG